MQNVFIREQQNVLLWSICNRVLYIRASVATQLKNLPQQSVSSKRNLESPDDSFWMKHTVACGKFLRHAVNNCNEQNHISILYQYILIYCKCCNLIGYSLLGIFSWIDSELTKQSSSGKTLVKVNVVWCAFFIKIFIFDLRFH